VQQQVAVVAGLLDAAWFVLVLLQTRVPADVAAAGLPKLQRAVPIMRPPVVSAQRIDRSASLSGVPLQNEKDNAKMRAQAH
jgi:hypothetical protein